MCNLNCYYAEDRRFDSFDFFSWLRVTQHSACNKWLPTSRWLQSSFNLQFYRNLQSQNWTEGYSNPQSQNWTEGCEEVQKKIIISNPNLFKQKWISLQNSITSKSISILKCRKIKSKYMFITGHFHVLAIRKPIPRFFRMLCLAPPSHHGQSTTLLWLERLSNKCAKLHTVAPCNNKNHVVLILFLPVRATYGCCSSRTSLRGESHIHTTLRGCKSCSKFGLEFLKWPRVKKISKMQTEKITYI